MDCGLNVALDERSESNGIGLERALNIEILVICSLSLDANLPSLTKSGALGAVLSLLSESSGKTDSRVQKDAGIALGCMVKLEEAQQRVLEAPNGIEVLIHALKNISIVLFLALILFYFFIFDI